MAYAIQSEAQHSLAVQVCILSVGKCLHLCRVEQAGDHEQTHKVEALCDVLDAALLKLPDWLSYPVMASKSATPQEKLSQVLLSPSLLDQMRKQIQSPELTV